jgi:hypothetical protein
MIVGLFDCNVLHVGVKGPTKIEADKTGVLTDQRYPTLQMDTLRVSHSI